MYIAAQKSKRIRAASASVGSVDIENKDPMRPLHIVIERQCDESSNIKKMNSASDILIDTSIPHIPAVQDRDGAQKLRIDQMSQMNPQQHPDPFSHTDTVQQPINSVHSSKSKKCGLSLAVVISDQEMKGDDEFKSDRFPHLPAQRESITSNTSDVNPMNEVQMTNI